MIGNRLRLTSIERLIRSSCLTTSLEKKELLPEPIIPDMEKYKKSRQQPPVSTATVPNTQQTVQEDDPEQAIPQDHRPETSQPTDEVITYGGMTEAAQRAYQLAYGIYLDQRKRHERESDMVKKLEDWNIKSTAQHFTDTCCKPTEDVRKHGIKTQRISWLEGLLSKGPCEANLRSSRETS
jgi:hypothetical protein